jgi:arylsulfatase A-like enzyme
MTRLVLPLAVLVLLRGAAGAAERPNFVFLFADDQRYDAMSVVQKEQGASGRFPWFKTPSMDRLAAEGVRFRNAFVVNSLCSPSRACFLTGRYSHANGIWNNRTPLDAKAVTHASLLRAKGYSTGYVGKWHMGQQSARPGFDWYASFTGQGTYFNANFLVNGKGEKADEWTDDRSADYAIRFLEKGRAKDKPFLLVVGFKAPHGPFTPPKRRADDFAGETARKVPNLGLRPGFNLDRDVKEKKGGGKATVNLNYFRCIAGVDDNVGKVLKALDRLKLAENTVVVYSSDNGFYLGEHGLADKRSGYEESIRIPLIVRWPKSGLKGVTRDDMVLNFDLAPTFLDLAGVAVPKEMHGKSWRPLLAKERPKAPFRTSFFYEYFRESGGKKAKPTSLGGFNTPTMTAVRTVTHKLLKYRGRPEWTELFDLAADPYETKNLFKDEKHAEVRKKLEKEHDRLAKVFGYKVPGSVPAEPKRE